MPDCPLAAICVLTKFETSRPNAVLEIELVKRAPASALPGCNSTEMIRTMQARMKIVNKVYVSKTSNLVSVYLS